MPRFYCTCTATIRVYSILFYSMRWKVHWLWIDFIMQTQGNTVFFKHRLLWKRCITITFIQTDINFELFLDWSDLNFWLTNRISQAWLAYKTAALCLEKTDYRLPAAAVCLFNYVVFQLFAEHWGVFTLYFFIPSDHIPPQKQESKEFSTRTIRSTLYWELPDCGQEAPTYLFYQGIESYLYYLKWLLSIEHL